MIKKYLSKEYFLPNGITVFFIFGVLANALNYFYRILMARTLGPEGFGEFTVLISLILILTVPSAPLQIVTARFSALLGAEDPSKKLAWLFRYLNKIVFFLICGLFLLIIIFGKSIQHYLNLSSINYVYFLGLITSATLILGITRGALQGLRKFFHLSFNSLVESSLRVVLGWIFIILGFKLSGALAGFLIPIILVYFLTIYLIRGIFTGEKKDNFKISTGKKELKEIWGYVFYSFLTLFFLNILLNIDMILAKHYFSPFSAGIYSAFVTFGRAIFVLNSLLLGIMFPIVVSKHARKENCFSPLKIYCLFISFSTILILSVTAVLPKILLFFGKEYIAYHRFFLYYGLLMGIYSFIFILSYFFMAINKFKFLYILASGSILEVLLISFWHASFLQIISMFLITLIITLFGMLFLMFLERRYLGQTIEIPIQP